jgi:hypothetical protein
MENVRKDLEMSAYKDTDGMNYEKTEIMKVVEFGFPTEKINVDAVANDIRAFWQMHERKLWAILIICGFYIIGAII